MIAGTSTGGIIALGLGVPISEIAEFYRDDSRRIFPPIPSRRIARWVRFCRSLLGAKLDHQALESALKLRFGERLLGESNSRLVIPAFMVPRTEIAVFKTDHHVDFRNDHATPAWKVARATSAAPTYLKGMEHEESGRLFVDGGVWANNPVMVALVDALSAYTLTFEQIDVLSIGTGNPPFSLSRRQAVRGLIAWREAIKAAMFLTTDNATAQAMLLLGPQHCLRIEPSGADADVEMNDYDDAFCRLPSRAARDFGEAASDIARFFEDVAEPRERHHSRA